MIFFIFPIIVALDQFTKFLAEKYLSFQLTLPVISGIFHLTLVHNKGAAFGIFKGAEFFFVALSFICIIFIIRLNRNKVLFAKVFFVGKGERLIRISLGLILGGTIGNLIDRLRFSYVVDFLDFRIWPVFNVADSAITIGAILICWILFRKGEAKT